MEKKEMHEMQLGERIVKQAQNTRVANDAEYNAATASMLFEQQRQPVKRRRVNRRWYTDEDKAAALAHLQSRGGVINRAARELGIPVMTLSDWAAGKSISPKVAEQFRVVRDAMSAQLEAVAHQVVDAMPDKIEAATLRDLAVTLTPVIDGMRLLREEPTAVTESTNHREMLERLIERTMEQFPGMTREKVIDIIRDQKPEAIKFLS